MASPTSLDTLERALGRLLGALAPAASPSSLGDDVPAGPPPVLCRLAYKQRSGGCASAGKLVDGGKAFVMAPPSTALAFEDAVLADVKAAWAAVVGGCGKGEGGGEEYMRFTDREGMGEEEDDE
jgi:hypothetical protein